MTTGTLYGIGVGPGDPEWVTVKAVKALSACRHVYVPKTQAAAESIALDIARSYLRPDAVTHELTFPMTADEHLLRESWREAAREVHRTLAAGDDCCFLTLGDPFLYSTYVYLSRELRAIDAGAKIVTIPGITAMSAAAAVAGFPIGQQKRLVTIVPGSDDMGQFTASLDRGGTVVLMKIGRGLETVLAELESRRPARPGGVRFSRRHATAGRRDRFAAAPRNARAYRLPVDSAG